MNTIIFDLDGTLLPLDRDKFIKLYFGKMSEFLEKKGIESKSVIKSILIGTEAMIRNNGDMTNEKRFWSVFHSDYGTEINNIEEILQSFYEKEFVHTKVATDKHNLAYESIEHLKEKGYKVILATNPLFPQIATYSRIDWAGLKPEDFSLVTTYENSSYAKPNKEYYKEILKKIDRKPSECMMIGNDVDEDMVVMEIGMDAFLLNENIINKNNKDLDYLKQGDFKSLFEYLKKLPDLN